MNAPEYATSGYTGETNVNVSSVGSGQQQRANAIYGETVSWPSPEHFASKLMIWQTFICPSYWQAEAYSGKGRTSYKYQFSVPPALHGADVAGKSCLLILTLFVSWQKPTAFSSSITNRLFPGYFQPPGGQVGPDFAKAFQTIWGNFITTDNPSIDSSIAIGAAAASNSSSTSSTNPASSWPPFTIYAPNQLNLNQTGGTRFQAPQSPTQNVTEYGSRV